jgi:hypothetical protein
VNLREWLQRYLNRVLARGHSSLYRRGLGRRMGRIQVVLLTTIGRKSGRPTTNPLNSIFDAYTKKTSREIPLALLRVVP